MNHVPRVRPAAIGEAMTLDQCTAFERDGYLVLPAVLNPNEVAYYASVHCRRTL